MRNFLGRDSSLLRTGDSVETFNCLVWLRVKHTAATVGYSAEFERAVDTELPTDARIKLTSDGKIKPDGEFEAI